MRLLRATASSITYLLSSLNPIRCSVTNQRVRRLTLQEGRRSGYTERHGLTSEKHSFPKCTWTYFKIAAHMVYHPGEKRLLPVPSLPLAAVHSNPHEASRRRNSPPPYIAINSNYFGKGAERVAFRCRLSDREHIKGFVFEDMVAKETVCGCLWC